MATSLSPEELAEIHAIAQSGRIQPLVNISLEASTNRPLYGETVTVDWSVDNNRQPIEIRINQQLLPGEAPASGQWQSQVYEITNFEIIADNTVRSVLINPMVVKPKILEFDLSDREPKIGEPLHIQWNTMEADNLEIRIVNDNDQCAHHANLEPQGELEITPDKLGKLSIEIIARAATINLPNGQQIEGRVATQLCDIEVKAHPPVVHISDLPKRISVGQILNLNWETEYAETVHVYVDGEEISSAQHGNLELPAESKGKKKIEICAEGPGGNIRRSIPVNVIVPNVQLELVISANRITTGSAATISWNVKHAKTVSLSSKANHFASFEQHSGSIQVPIYHNDEITLSCTTLDDKIKTCKKPISVKPEEAISIMQELRSISSAPLKNKIKQIDFHSLLSPLNKH